MIKVAALLLVSSIQYLVVTQVVAHAWTAGFDWKNNYTSDLGNTGCGIFENLYVCSPLHNLMNASFIFQGISLLIAALLLAKAYHADKFIRFGFYLLALGGVGSIIVGLIPENIDFNLHSLAALLPFFLGNVGIVLTGLSRSVQGRIKYFSLGIGIAALFAFILFMFGIHLGMGMGGMERMVDYLQIIWILAIGMYLLLSEAKSVVIKTA